MKGKRCKRHKFNSRKERVRRARDLKAKEANHGSGRESGVTWVRSNKAKTIHTRVASSNSRFASHN
jgi:hypothetical protein